MGKFKSSPITGAFAWRLIEMIESPASRVLSLSAKLVLERLEIELYQHGGRPGENGKLPCTYEHFVEFGEFTMMRLRPRSVNWWRWVSLRSPGGGAPVTRASASPPSIG